MMTQSEDVEVHKILCSRRVKTPGGHLFLLEPAISQRFLKAFSRREKPV
jgi:hypothetical protein